MAASDKILMYPEARTTLSQLGFDTETQTIDELISGEYLQPYSTTIEFVSNEKEINESSDKALRESISQKLGMPIYNQYSYFLIIYRSYQTYSFFINTFESIPPQRLQYTIAGGGKWLRSYPFGGIYTANLQSENYVSCTLRICDGNKSLRIGGYSTKAMKVNTEYTIARWHSDEIRLCAPESTSMITTQYLSSTLQYIALITIDQEGIKISPRGKDIPVDTALLCFLSYI